MKFAPTIGVFLLVVVGCSGQTPQVTDPDLRSTPPDTTKGFKILTYNALHGLKVGKHWVSPGETTEENQARFELQVNQLAQVQPDLIFLQEVNPLPERAVQYVAALRARGLNYNEVHQVDSCGWRFSKYIALFKELNNGLVILSKDRLRLRRLEGLKLSGPGACHDTWGIQFGELRYALIGEITLTDTSETFLLVDVHLHSGIESDAHFLKELSVSHRQGRLQHYEQLKDTLLEDQATRLEELNALRRELDKVVAKGSYAGIIIGGDFNFEQESPEYNNVVGRRAIDLEKASSGPLEDKTINPEGNPLARRDVDEIPPEVRSAVADELPDDQKEVIADYRRNIHRRRKVDYIFLLPIHPDAVPWPGAVKQELFGTQIGPAHLSGSDHYGLLYTFGTAGAD